MKRTRLLLLFSLLAGFLALLVSPATLAQDSPTADTAAAAAVTDAPATADAPATVDTATPDPASDEEVSWEEWGKMFEKVFTDFKTFGVLAGFVTLIGLLMLTLRLKIVNDWLEKKGWKKYKPFVAAGLAGIVAFLAALKAGRTWLEGLAAGVIAALAGWAATGGHQALTSLLKGKE